MFGVESSPLEGKMVLSQAFVSWAPDQARYAVETGQQYDAWLQATARSRKFAGGMSWKIVRGRRYLVRTLDRKGTQKSLGPHSPETEQVFEKFWRDKQAALDRLRASEGRLAELARINVALRLNRVPSLPARLLTVLSRRGLLGGYVHVVGTHALFAYEAMAGAFLTPGLLETSDLDFMVDERRLKLAVHGVATPRLIDVLREVDPTFEQEERTYSARNKAGFEVDLIRAAARDPLRRSKGAVPPSGDLQAVDIPNLKWLLNAPKVRAVAIGEDGFPVPLSVPDPRAFALYKFYLGQAADRDPRKRIRDDAQARALAALVEERLPAFPFDPAQLRMFPTLLRHGAVLPSNPFFSTADDPDNL